MGENVLAAPSPKIDSAAREAGIVAQMPVVKMLANKLARRIPWRYPLEDLVGAGMLALVANYDKYDPTRGSLEGFVDFRVTAGMKDALRSDDHLSRGERMRVRQGEREDVCDCEYVDIVPDRRANQFNAVLGLELRALVRQRLTRQEFTVIRSIYWDGIPQRETAESMGLSPGRVSQLKNKAFKKLRWAMENRSLQ